MLLNFSAGEDCPCPEEIQEELNLFHNELRLHCGTPAAASPVTALPRLSGSLSRSRGVFHTRSNVHESTHEQINWQNNILGESAMVYPVEPT